ncbi:DUF1934 domain-containing protein [Paenibacillus chartarius]|uniref:DUF1934 domain-containing protein n=1 Tax=Paenibacillus chartarius TaxID=747481 RepID=A0ABV6DS66_9BACL
MHKPEAAPAPRPPVKVAVTVESRGGGQRTAYRTQGDWYDKGDRSFIRYAEPAKEYGRTTTIVNIGPASVKILRQGDIRSDMTFVQGELRIGYYETAQGRMELAVRTRSVRDTWSSARTGSAARVRRGAVELAYDLEVAGERAGTYHVKLTIQEELSS